MRLTPPWLLSTADQRRPPSDKAIERARTQSLPSENVAPTPRRRVFSFAAGATPGPALSRIPGPAPVEEDERRPLTRPSVDTQDEPRPIRMSQPARRRTRKLSKSRPPTIRSGPAAPAAQTKSQGPERTARSALARRLFRTKDSHEEGNVLRSTSVLTTVLRNTPVPCTRNGITVAPPPTSPGELKYIRAQLSRPHDAKRIVASVKLTAEASSAPATRLESIPEDEAVQRPQASRAICLAGPDHAVSSDVGTGTAWSGSLRVLNLIPTSAGAIVGLAGEASGTIDALGDLTAELVKQSGAHVADDGSLVPVDRSSIWVYWWGYEIALPPPSLAHLASARSIQKEVFALIGAMLAAGSVPELLPFVQYASDYLDLEWRAIVAEDHGQGVVLAATWILPVALFPRPWDLSPAA